MSAQAQSWHRSADCYPQRRASGSGHYQYKSWQTDANGQRMALKYAGRSARTEADLASNSYRNADGLETIFGIVFDFDAHRAKDHWKDGEGRLDWSIIFPAIRKVIPEVADLICYVVRSTGGLGLGVVMAISPLVMVPSTTPNQQSALKLQGRLLALFDRLGLGADFGARGVSRDLPNFNNPDRLVFSNTQCLRDLEASGRPVVSQLHKLLNARDQAERKNERLYKDERVEKGLARLVLWLMGVCHFERALPGAAGNWEGRKRCQVPYLSGWSITVTTRDLCVFTGLSEAFLRKFLKDPPKWLRAAYCEGEGWVLSIPLSADVLWLEERSSYLINKTQQLTGRSSFDPESLCLPWWVDDGERNSWIVRLALLYKWAGYSFETALEKVLLRVQGIPGYEASRNCRQVRAIVRSLFRRRPETNGSLHWGELPEWIKEDSIFCSLLKRASLRRGVTPSGEPGPGVVCEGCPSPVVTSLPGDSCVEQVEDLDPQTLRKLANETAFRVEIVLIVVRFKQRIGIFHEGKLILCLTRRHYKASRVLLFLKERFPDYGQCDLRLVSPRKASQKAYFGLIEQADVALPAHVVCGRRSSFKHAIDRIGSTRILLNPEASERRVRVKVQG